MFTLWPRLPIELKVRVLEYAVHTGEPIDYARNYRNFKRKGCLGTFIGTRNDEITQLSIECYYRINTFHLTLETFMLSWSDLGLLRPQRECARMIRHLKFSAYLILPTVKTGLFYCHSTWPWAFVFTAENGLDAPTPGFINSLDKAFVAERAELWHDFNNLQTFEVSLSVYKSTRLAGFNPGNVGATNLECFCNDRSCIEKAWRHSRLGFKAKKCVVTLKVPQCVSGNCNKRLNAVLEGAISTK